jgi:hypothetical protein
MFLEHRGNPGKPVGKLAGTHERRATRRGHRSQESGHHLGPRPEPDRSRICRQRVVSAEDLSRDVRIRGATDIEQQTRGVRLRRRLRVDTQTVCQPHREQRAVQPMLEGHPDAKVRRQREGRDHFRGTDGSADARSILGHPATVTERLISSHQAHELPTEQRASACRRSTEPLSKPGLRDPFSLGGSRSRLIWQRSIPVSRAFSRTHVRFARWSSCRKASHDVAVRREYRKCVRSVSVRSSPRQHQSADWQAL